MTNAYLLAGLPGSGKSTVADLGSDITGGSVIRSGDVVRRLAEEDGLESPSSRELGDFAASMREENGPEFVATTIVRELLQNELVPDEPVFIDGVRHRQEIVEYSQYFGSIITLWIEAPTRLRLKRMKERARDGEEEFDALDLMSRDSTELDELGVNTIIGDDTPPNPDITVTNNNGINSLQSRVSEIVEQ